jgi:translocation and assembly module TamB
MKRKLSIIIISLLAFAVVFFLLRGPYLSNSIKRVIVPVLENTTGERVIIDNAVINLFPFYIQAKGLKIFDKDGNRLLWVTKTRMYMDLLGLFTKEIRIRKLTIKEPDLNADEGDLRRIIENIKQNASSGREKKYRLSLRNLELTDGAFHVENAKGTVFEGSGLFLEMTARNDISARLRVNEAVMKSPGLAEMRGSVGGSMKMKEGRMEITEIDIQSAKSYLRAKGQMSLDPGGDLKGGSLSGKAEIHEDTFRQFLNLKTEKEGILSFEGNVNITTADVEKRPRVIVDLTTDSSFHLETLMEAVKVNENITGKLSVKGKIAGTFPDLYGSGTAKLQDALVGGLQINGLAGKIEYGERKFTLSDFTARTYEGSMKGKASIMLPYGDYMVDADISRVSSPKFFKFIRWEPPFPAGSVSGHFRLTHNHGENIEVSADAHYENNSAKEGDLLDRLRTIKCQLHLKDDVLKLSDTVLSTSVSDLLLNGDIDFTNKMMGLDVQFSSRDLSDMTSPYYTRLIAPAEFKGRAKGPLQDPEISGTLEAGPGSIHGLTFTHGTADLVYRISSLSVPRLNITDGKSFYDAAGSIEFRKAEGLFSFKGPLYKAKAAVKDVQLKPFITLLYRDIPISGSTSGTISFDGDPENFTSRGDLVVRDGAVYGQQFDRIEAKAVLQPGHIEFPSVAAQRGDSVLDAKGRLSFDGQFSLSASSHKINLSDINQFQNLSLGGSADVSVEGSGTFERPNIRFSAHMPEGTFRGIKTGKAEAEGTLKDKELSARGTFMNGHISADAKALLSPKRQWSVDVGVNEGSYDFLLSGFMKTPPEDLALSLEGKIKIKGEGEKISLLSRFNYLNCTLYGYNLRNTGDIVLELADREFSIKSFSLAGDHATLSAKGAMKPNEQLDVEVRGNLNLAPMKIFSEKFTSLKGGGNFTVDITGPWDKPDVTGEVNVNDASLSLTVYPYKVGPVNGTVFLKKDRFTFESVKAGFGGGSITLSGVGYLKGIAVKRIFLSSTLQGITARPVEKVSATVDGRLFYETSEKGAVLSGNIDIRKARYEKDIEWNKWLINLRDMNRETVRYPDFLRNTEFNVYVSGSDNISIDNNLAKTPVKLAVTVTGNVSRLGLVGRVESQEGTVYFRSNEFKILEGSNVDFVDSHRITPVFHLLAETYTGEYYIKLNLDGTIDKFTLSLFSDPPLSEMEILNLLTFGQTKKDSRGIESGIAASEAASILTGGLQDVVQEKFRSITGFERFSIEPHTSSTGAVSPKITIGKRLLEDKLFVVYSTSVGTTEENVIRLEYKVDKNLSLVGSKDELGSVGGDVKFRFEFK